MWYLKDVSVKTWLKIHPGLKASFSMKCPECGKIKEKATPIIRKDLAGIELEGCSCGDSESWILTPRNKELCKKYRDEFFSLQEALVN